MIYNRKRPRPVNDEPRPENIPINVMILNREFPNRTNMWLIGVMMKLQYELHELNPKAFGNTETDAMWRYVL